MLDVLDGPLVRHTAALIHAIEDGRRVCERANLELLAAYERLERLGRPLNAVIRDDRGSLPGRRRAAPRPSDRDQGQHRRRRPGDDERLDGRRAAAGNGRRRGRGARARGRGDVFCKMNLLEYGAGSVNPAYGMTYNPSNPGRTSGGSSSGSAALVGAGVCEAAVGTDSGGSIRVPASYCGIVGVKPTTGSVPAAGLFPLSRTCDGIGPLATTVAGAARLLEVLQARPCPIERVGRLRIGVVRSQLDDPDIRPLVRAGCRRRSRPSPASVDDGPASGGAPPKPGFGPLKLDGWEVYVEPRAMWKQIYNETWRIERDFFYDPHYHGLDLDKARKKYAPYLDGIASREELTYLFQECLGEMTVGHMFVGGGEAPEPKKLKGGLLGADYSLENGRYRVAKVYNGENWNPGNEAPLTQPGVNVKAGDYILAVNGRDLHASDNIFTFFEETAGKQVVLKVGPNPDGKESREVTVIPVESEENLRHLAWIEDNRRRVDQATGGRIAYVHVPNTAGGGYTSFNRYFFSQVGKEGAIIDERFNEGGQLADYIIDYLRRPMMSKVVTRDGHDWSSPSEAIYGPKVMIINEMSGSGGDALPWYFRKAAIGPLIGKKTWGGLVGIGGYPELIDGGRVTAPRAAIYGLNGEWEVENHGVAPDVEVDLDPAAFRQGHDAQLEKAIEVVMQQLKEHPLPEIKRPPYPNYHEHDDLGVK